MDLSQYHDKGYTGILNLGNTCFMNSCIQVLNHIYELKDVLSKVNVKNKKHKLKSHDNIILEEWTELQELMWSKNGIVSPIKFVKNVQKVAKLKGIGMFSGWDQNDLSEFLLFIIECLHKGISRGVRMHIDKEQINILDKKALACYKLVQDCYEKEFSEIMDIFYAISISEIESLDGKENFTMKPELFLILDLPIPSIENTNTINLLQCFDEYVKPEFIGGDNSWYHEEKKIYMEINKKMSFWSFPKIFVITLKRFSPCGNQKINNFVSFPLENFDLSKYVCGYNPTQYVYDLFGVCNHYGGVQGGHYNAFVLNSKKEWVLFDDTVCQTIEIGEVVTPDAYCLFYRRQKL
jgi:ubiquitin carboxyl-terminal hydrolase 8